MRCQASTQVLLQLGPGAPLSAVCKLAGGGWARLYLAPVLEEGGEGEGAQQQQQVS